MTLPTETQWHDVITAVMHLQARVVALTEQVNRQELEIEALHRRRLQIEGRGKAGEFRVEVPG